jgi:NADH-quinone oxidoreductase subunit J
MNEALAMTVAATLFLAVGMWLMLPREASGGRWFGALLVAAGLGVLASQVPRLGEKTAEWVNDGVFFVLAGVTVLAALCTVTFRNPGYSAIWFGLSLLGTAGLFLFQGAQFLGVATIVVYAGAILVTFLFVLMLAQPKGEAAYDRLSWGGGLAAVTGALVAGVLALTILGVFQNPVLANRPHAPFPLPILENEILAEQHVAHLGAQLFSRYLVAVEVAGTLLLVALVGTVAIVERIKKPERGGHSDG